MTLTLILWEVKKATISVAPIHLRVLTILLPSCSHPWTSYPLAQASSIRPCSLEMEGTPAPFVMPNLSAEILNWRNIEFTRIKYRFCYQSVNFLSFQKIIIIKYHTSISTHTIHRQIFNTAHFIQNTYCPEKFISLRSEMKCHHFSTLLIQKITNFIPSSLLCICLFKLFIVKLAITGTKFNLPI